MARGSIPAQAPIVPQEVFLAMDLLYRFVNEMSSDLRSIEGATVKVDESVASSTTLADSPTLQFAMEPSRKYRISAELYFSANVKLRHTGPASPLLVSLARQLTDSGGNSQVFDSAYSSSDIVLANAGVLKILGIVHNGATAGIFKLRWAQNSSSSTASQLYAGSVLRHSLID